MLDLALRHPARDDFLDACLQAWPQKSATNKTRMWNHLTRRYLTITERRVQPTPFLRMYEKLQGTPAADELIFYQLCLSTPLVLRTLRSLARDALLNTGEARFTRYHLEQILVGIFGRLTQSTSERVRQILREGGRLRQEGEQYIARGGCPRDAVLGFGLYADSERLGWRSPASAVIVAEADIAAAFLCTRPLLIAGLQRLANLGHCEYHSHGGTDQVQLRHANLEEFVHAWAC
jgi:hypothetical protein